MRATALEAWFNTGTVPAELFMVWMLQDGLMHKFKPRHLPFLQRLLENKEALFENDSRDAEAPTIIEDLIAHLGAISSFCPACHILLHACRLRRDACHDI